MEQWGIILYFLLIGVLMFIAKVLKTWLPGLNKIVIPTALLAGIIGLIFSLVFAPIFTDKDTFYDIDVLSNMVYHALAIGFLALSLKRTPVGQKESKKKIWSTGMIITSTYALQAVIGIAIVFLFFSDNFIGSGMLVALGFGQGPGLALSIGTMWSDFLGGNGATLGVSYSFLGFVFGGTVGVLIINVFSRRKGIAKPESYSDESNVHEVIEIDTVKEISVLDGLTTQVIIISLIYSAVYLTLLGLYHGLGALGGAGDAVYGLIKGFNFIIAILYALIYKQILRGFEKKGKNVRFMTNNYILSNITSAAFNLMIAGSVLTITLSFLSEYGLQLIITAVVAGTATLFYLRYITKKVYTEYQDEYFIGLFGMLTGVASTGLALLKGVDPKLETPVSEEMVLGSGTAISMALPLFVLLFIPTFTSGLGNEVLWNWITFIGIFLYVIIFVGILLIRGRNANNRK
jgi:ESS family glutamate:Na+ symporter